MKIEQQPPAKQDVVIKLSDHECQLLISALEHGKTQYPILTKICDFRDCLVSRLKFLGYTNFQ